jgi:hypothetical protein
VSDRRNGLPRNILPITTSGVIQLVLTSPANGAIEVGFLPAFFLIERVQVITPGGAGTYALDLPAYDGLASQSVVAAGASASSSASAATLVAGARMIGFDRPRPISINPTGVTGIFRLGVFGFPMDDASIVS